MKLLKDIFTLLNRSQKIEMLSIFILMFILMFIEVISIGLIIPIATLFSRPELVYNSPYLSGIINYLQTPSPIILFLYATCLFLSVVIVKSIVTIFILWRQSKFSFKLMKNFSQKIFSKYLNNSWEFHLQNNSSVLLRNITDETSLFTQTFLLSLMVFVNQIITIIGIFIFILYIEPFGSIIVFLVLFFVAATYQLITRKFISNWGQVRQDTYGERNMAITQGLSGIKEIKLMKKESYFLNQFIEPNKKAADIQVRLHTLSSVPKNLLETISAIGLVLLTFIIIYQDKDIDFILPILALFVAAAFRILPSINQILSALQSVIYSYPSLKIIKNDLLYSSVKKINSDIKSEITFAKELELRDVSYNYPKTKKASLHSINFKMLVNTTVGIIGQSGAGKSTLVDIVLGLLKPTSGEVLVDGINIEKNIDSWQITLGYVPQTMYMIDESILKNIALGVPQEKIDYNKITEVIEAADIKYFIQNLPNGLNTNVGEKGVKLSGGQRQRIGIARALYTNPNVLILDEFTSSLDIETEKKIMDSINNMKKKITIIIISHRHSVLEGCNKIIRIQDGKLIST